MTRDPASIAEALADIAAQAARDAAAAAGDAIAITQYDTWCESTCALELATQIGATLGLQTSEVLDTLAFVPDNIPELLSSPKGWELLGQFVADYLLIDPGDYAPTVQ